MLAVTQCINGFNFIKLEESKDGKRWVHDRTAFKLNELLRQKKELENGIVKSWDESLVILEETSK